MITNIQAMRKLKIYCRIALYVCALLINGNARGSNLQETPKLRAYFAITEETIHVEANEAHFHTFTITVPAQEKFHESKVKVSAFFEHNELDKHKIYMPINDSLLVNGSHEVIREFEVGFLVDKCFEGIIHITLMGIDKDGSIVNIDPYNSKKTITIKVDNALNPKETEFILFTGTNLDFFDGIKAKELYFMGTYLFNLQKNNQPSNHWFHIYFGRNRFISSRDTILDIPFSSPILNQPLHDSLLFLHRGFYNGERETTTNNTFFNIDFLIEFDAFKSNYQRFFLSLGYGFSMLSIDRRVRNIEIFSQDTLSVPFEPRIRINPIVPKLQLNEINNRLEFGVMHVQRNDKFYIKTQVKVGYGINNYPDSFRLNSIDDNLTYATRGCLFFRIGMNAIILNPGLAFGVEIVTLSPSQQQFVNATLSSALDVSKIGALFSKTNPLIE